MQSVRTRMATKLESGSQSSDSAADAKSSSWLRVKSAPSSFGSHTTSIMVLHALSKRFNNALIRKRANNAFIIRRKQQRTYSAQTTKHLFSANLRSTPYRKIRGFVAGQTGRGHCSRACASAAKTQQSYRCPACFLRQPRG